MSNRENASEICKWKILTTCLKVAPKKIINFQVVERKKCFIYKWL